MNKYFKLIHKECVSSGSHFNPESKTHGNINSSVRHIGDFGNIESDNTGTVIATFSDSVAKLYGPHGIIGRTVILHQNEDDLGLGGNEESLKTGNAGKEMNFQNWVFFFKKI